MRQNKKIKSNKSIIRSDEFYKTYNRKVRDFYDHFVIDAETAAQAFSIKKGSFSRLTGTKSMVVSRSLKRDEYISFIKNIISIYRSRIKEMENVLESEKSI